MQVTDISIDLETLSTRFDAAVLSIGARAFNRHTGGLGRSFYAEINLDDAIRNGHVSGSTLAWWMDQNEDAKKVLTGSLGKWPAVTAMRQLYDYVDSHGNVCVWGNGATFDITLLEHAFSKTHPGQPLPWEFWNIRDMRTIVDVASAAGFDKKSIPFDGTVHNAQHDATHQAKVIAAAWQHVVSPVRGGEVPIPAESALEN